MDSTTAIEIVTSGHRLFAIALAIFIIAGIYCTLKDLIFGDE